MTPVDWRRAFMRLLAEYLNETLGTGLDIVDASESLKQGDILRESGQVDMNKTYLSDDNIVVLVELGEKRLDVGVVCEIADHVRETLEKPLRSIGVKKNLLELSFHGDGGTTE